MKKGETTLLNLGCGKDTKEGYINIDCVKNTGVDMVHDLNVFPYPFEDNEITEVIAKDVMEHVKDAKAVIEELWRICKHDATIYIKTAHFTSPVAWTDLTHVRPFGRNSFGFYQYDKDLAASTSLNSTPTNCPVKFDVKSKFLFNRYFRFLGLGILFNRFPKFYENIVPWMFPAGLMEFKLRVVKE